MAASLKASDFEEPYDPTNFVERISANVVGGGTKGGQEGFDPVILRDHFLETIKALQQLSEQTDGQIAKLEHVCQDQEQIHKEKAADVEKQYKTTMSKFYDLDDRINSVATKVVHLGDQLENISIPRQRVQETEQVMKYFDEFHSGKDLTSPIFKDSNKLHEAAAIICQLQMVADELPRDKFERVQRKIQEKYSSIESDLQREFVNAYKKGDIDTMAKSAKTLLPFKNYHLCYEELIKMAMDDFFQQEDVFNDVLPACQQVQDIANKVFEHNAEHVLARFVQYIFDKKLAGYIYRKLPEKEVEEELYLKKLATLYGRSKEINKKLSELRIGSDSTFLDRISKPMFSKYLNKYIEDELQYLEAESASTLNRFYNSIGHVKKEIKQNFMSDMPDSLKELQRKIPGRDKNTLKDILLSQDVAVTLLQENKLAIRRCEMLSSPSDLPNNVFRIFKIFLKYLGEEHFEYAVEVTLQFLPPLEPKVAPDLLFLNVLYQSNTIFHLIEKHFTDYVLRNVGSSTIYSECASKKKLLIDNLESKLNQGMERILQSMVNYLKFILNSEQKKSDFRPETQELMGAVTQTTACTKCCRYMKSALPELRNSLDGKNLEVVLTEFGTRFHRLLLDHLYQYTFSDVGAMVALCDVNEYRHTIKLLKIPLLDKLFSVLLALVNLLVVQPDNLKDVGGDEQLADIDKSVLQQFVQLRADYKGLKLGKVFS
ncbi:exocyst complex component 5-like [Hydractinia symbiolongicarpus]|uniref:exocyst complex component 5-like n=1 Tax=Hydractinia symbiolongicarpus TaxID=13093 RepID=UPI00254B3BEE|nr:exocyst complex component 5-like [Hydractinia symbiolongicarpus]